MSTVNLKPHLELTCFNIIPSATDIAFVIIYSADDWWICLSTEALIATTRRAHWHPQNLVANVHRAGALGIECDGRVENELAWRVKATLYHYRAQHRRL